MRWLVVFGADKAETRWWLRDGSHRVVVTVMDDASSTMDVGCGWKGRVRGSVGSLVW